MNKKIISYLLKFIHAIFFVGVIFVIKTSGYEVKKYFQINDEVVKFEARSQVSHNFINYNLATKNYSQQLFEDISFMILLNDKEYKKNKIGEYINELMNKRTDLIKKFCELQCSLEKNEKYLTSRYYEDFDYIKRYNQRFEPDFSFLNDDISISQFNSFLVKHRNELINEINDSDKYIFYYTIERNNAISYIFNKDKYKSDSLNNIFLSIIAIILYVHSLFKNIKISVN